MATRQETSRVEPAAPRQSRENGRRTRQRLLASAIALWSERGSLGVTISAVAERAGTTRRTVYHHFATHEALLAATEEFVDTELASLSGGEVGPYDNPYKLVPGLAADNPELIRSVLSRLLTGNPMDNPIFANGVRHWSLDAPDGLKAGVPPEHASAVAIGMWYAANLVLATKGTPAERRREAERFAQTYEQLMTRGIYSESQSGVE
ncbi:MAG TPA: helix-turn-helix domain-containing protein [Novosphingobium sp.]|nr:helix-turn-helix domain-containing protein [Novosphingobium sp.]